MRKLLVIALVLAATTAAAKTRDAYIICIDGQTPQAMLNVATALPQALTMCERYGSDFLWVRRNGREIVIRDPAFLAKADGLFAPQRALEPEQNAIARDEKALDEEEDHLEQVAGRNEAAVRERLHKLHERQRVVEGREEDVDQSTEAQDRLAEAELWRMIDDVMRKR